jgi:hypothetical protein
MNLSPGAVKSLLGRKEAVRGFNLLSKQQNAAMYATQLGLVARANTDFSALRAKVAISNPVGDSVDMAGRITQREQMRLANEGAARQLELAIQERETRTTFDRAVGRFGDNVAGRGLGFLGAGVVDAFQAYGNVKHSVFDQLQHRLVAEKQLGPGAGGITPIEGQQIKQLLEQQRLQERQLDVQEEQRDELKVIAELLRESGLVGTNE